LKVIFAFLFLIGLTAGQLAAATLNFDTTRSGVSIDPLTFPEATIMPKGGQGLYVYHSGLFGMPIGGGICGLQAGFSCTGDISIMFKNPVSNLKFRGYTASVSDGATVTAYSENTVIGNLLVSGTASEQIDIDFRGLSGITRVDFFDRSNPVSRGIAYGNFNFDIDLPKPPTPPKAPPEVLGFDAFTNGLNATTLDLGKAVIRQVSGGRIFVYRTGSFGMPQNGGICAFENDTCMGDLLLEFDVPVIDLIFAAYFAKSSDAAFISLFDGDTLLSKTKFFGNPAGTIRFDFSSANRLTKVLIEDASAGEFKGMAFGDFKYRNYVAPVLPPIPVPASVFLMLAGVMMLLGLRSRRVRG
jgi:hypothetical protein